MRFVNVIGAAALGIVMLVTTAHSASNVDLSADSMEIIDSENKMILTGNVIATRASDTIRASEMVVTSTEQKKEDGTSESVANFVDAKGNISITTKNATITGEWCKFDVIKNTLVVGGNVKVVQGSTVLKGPKLNVNLTTNRLQMSGGRVSGSFVPK